MNAEHANRQPPPRQRARRGPANAMDDSTMSWLPEHAESSEGALVPCLIVLYSAHEPARVGEVARLEQGTTTLGRRGDLTWMRQRPEHNEPTGPMADPHLSRSQLEITRTGDTIRAQNVGRLPLRLNGRPVAEVELQPGDRIEIGDRLLLAVDSRPPALPALDGPLHAFGQPDADGWVGESPQAWAVRRQLRFIARRDTSHVLILGPSGTGKELVAKALHRHSSRGPRPLVSRNAATIPESLADAELFGNIAGYPNPRMVARRGLIGEADGSSLFLDEVGELPIELQAKLLRVMDAGEFTRLGDSHSRSADLRVIGATNRSPDELKEDVVARFSMRIEIPDLNTRAADIPLIARHLLRQIAREDAEVASRYFPGGDPDAEPRLSFRLVKQLVTHTYGTHVRELIRLLWRSISLSTGDRLEALRASDLQAGDRGAPSDDEGPTRPHVLSPAAIQDALDRNGGRQEDTWRELGLSSRHVLARLIRKYDLEIRRPE